MRILKILAITELAASVVLSATPAMAASYTASGPVIPGSVIASPAFPNALKFSIYGDPNALVYCVSKNDLQSYPIVKSDMSNGLVNITITGVTTFAEISAPIMGSTDTNRLHSEDCGLTSNGALGPVFVTKAQ